MSEQLNLTKERILVTGGAGFLGKELVRQLEAKGCRNIFVPRSAAYDLTQLEAIKRCFDDSNPTVVFHLAARVGGIGANRANPGKFFYDNAIMGIQLIEESRLRGVKKFVCVGTVCSYPKFTPVPFKEEDLWNGYPEETNAPYGLAKKMLLVQLQAYRQQYGFNGIYLLQVNLYGPGDNFDPETSHVIPALIRKFTCARDRNAPEVILWGDSTPSREFLYRDDAVRGIIQAAELCDGTEPINLGSGCEVRISDLAELVKKLIGFKGLIKWDRTKPNGQPRRVLEVSKAKKLCLFEAKISLEDGLNQTIKWYREFFLSVKHR